MFRLPAGVTWLMVGAVVLTVFGGMWTVKQYSERQRLLGNLQAHAQTYPEDAPVVAVLVACHRKVVLDIESCGLKLIENFGPTVLARLGKMQEQGAFGRPVGPHGQSQ